MNPIIEDVKAEVDTLFVELMGFPLEEQDIDHCDLRDLW